MTHTPLPRKSRRNLVHFAEANLNPRQAKTSRGVLLYSPHHTLGFIDSTQAGKSVRSLLGVDNDAPVRARLADFLDGNPRPDTLVLGTVSLGGKLTPEMRQCAREAVDAGLDVWNGMHEFLVHDAKLLGAAQEKGVTLWDVRRPPENLTVGSARCLRAKSYICLGIGSDAAIGKMTTVLEMQKESQRRGVTAEFIATGQTGIMISGWGHPIDAIPGDFIAGCVEKDCLSVDGKCDIIYVEGQGSLFHPGFSAVTLGLMAGCCADGFILCHQPSRKTVTRMDHIPLPPLPEIAEYYLQVQRALKPAKVLGIALNTWGMEEDAARAACEEYARLMKLPVTDVCRFGSASLVDALEAHRKEVGK